MAGGVLCLVMILLGEVFGAAGDETFTSLALRVHPGRMIEAKEETFPPIFLNNFPFHASQLAQKRHRRLEQAQPPQDQGAIQKKKENKTP